MSGLPAETIGVRFGGQFSRGKFHIVDLPAADGPFRNARDYVARCGADRGGAAVCTSSLAHLLEVEQRTRSLVCKNCKRCQP